MAKEENDANSVSSCISLNAENYSQLFEAFKETHEEANSLVLVNNRLKGLNNWLENRVKTLEEELENSKFYFENMELLYENSSCKCDSLVCENCESIEKKVHYLMKIVAKLLILPVDLAQERCLVTILLTSLTPRALQVHTTISLSENLKNTRWRLCGRWRSDAQVSDKNTQKLRENILCRTVLKCTQP